MSGSSSPRTIRIGINGFGRMGRLFLREALSLNHTNQSIPIQIVHINDLTATPKTSAYLFKYDSVHGKWAGAVTITESDNTESKTPPNLLIDGKLITYSQQANPSLIPWRSMGIDIVIESSGAFTTTEKLQSAYFGYKESPSKVLVSAPVNGALNIVMGVNQNQYNHQKDHIVTAASCTTNCLAPIVKVLHEHIGISHGSITTVHNITNTQAVVDMAMKGDKDLRRMRSCVTNLVPTSTGSATAIALIFPELKGKLNGLAIRVPLLNSSITDCAFEMKRPTTREEVNKLFTDAASSGDLQNILGVETEPLVSIDFKDDKRSSIVDALSTMVINGTQVKVLSWYDNELGYATRMAEITQLIASQLPSTPTLSSL